MVIDEIAALWAIANIGTRFDPLRILQIANAASGIGRRTRRRPASTIDPLTGRPSYAAVLISQVRLHNPA